jgi:DNA invertase Pin-like site-specific DNA recombinase
MKTPTSYDTVIGYTRVSTAEQPKDGCSLAAQSERITAYCKLQGLRLARIYTDEGLSGSTLERPGLQAALRALDEKGGALVVQKLDRLSRNLADVCKLLAEDFAERDLITLCGLVDTHTAVGRLMSHQLASFAQFERELIAERTSETLAYLKGQGVKFGNCLFGQKYSEEQDSFGRRKVVDAPSELKQLTIMRELYAAGQGLAQIAHSLNAEGFRTRAGTPWSGSGVNQVLTASGVHKRKSKPRHERVAIADRAATLLGEGLSYRAICRQLTKEGYSPSRGGAWHPGSVQQLIRACSGQPAERAFELAQSLRAEGVSLYEIGVRLTLAGYKDGGAWYPGKIARLLARGAGQVIAAVPNQDGVLERCERSVCPDLRQ